MGDKSIFLKNALAQVAEAEEAKEALTAAAYQAFEMAYSTLAWTLIERLGTQAKVMRWLSMRRRIFDGRSAYHLLADGEVDAVWDQAGWIEDVDSSHSAEMG